MSTTHNKKIAEELIALNTNIFLWNREHIEKSFNINGKTKEGELTIRQFHILTFIKNGGIHTVSEISNWFNISKSSMSIMISKLEKNGYLRKEQASDTDDGRKMYFYLTEKGMTAVTEAEERVLETVAGCFSSLDEEKQEKVYTHLQELNRILKAGGLGE